ncbi:glycosyltransferase family 2 protein, partial [bacterium]|nr:glycosyltransferase family 2 protein [bacterium]
MTTPAVSVVIPVYNDAERLAACLAALAAQEGVAGGFEVVVVDDGSSDGPEAVVAEYAFARLVRQEKAGPAAARNRGAAEARAPLLAFIDSDCIPRPDWLAQLIRPFDDPTVSGVQGVYTTTQRALVARFAQYEIEERYAIMRRAEGLAMIGTYSAAF